MNRLYRSSNRYNFIERLKSSNKYYVVCIDIINFKSINDKFGSYNGDMLLSQVVEYIKSLSDNNLDINVCRYESDVIMVMLKSNCERDAFEFVNKITEYTYKYNINFRVGYKKIDSTVKLERFLESIIYVIKDKKYILDKEFDENFKLDNDIEKYFAIKQDIMTNDSSDFNLVYQPKIWSENNSIDSCEILSRWSNPKVGNSNPDEFISIIKHLEKELEFDLMIFEKACRELVDLEEVISKFSINISTKSISNDQFINKIYEIVNKYSIDTKNITIEILEDICDCNHIEISNNIDKLVKLGFSISIVDFGTGYSSYCRLAELNFSEVKISREFLTLENQSTNKKNKKILLGIVSMCKALNCKIVIEGVETEENIKLAKELEVDYIQGYYYSKPLDKAEYRAFINDYTA